MDDQFLNEQRRDPDSGFAARLHERLKSQGAARPTWRPAWTGIKLAPLAAGGVAMGAMILLFTLPSVRASAQAFLDLFRVRSFAAVPVNEERIEKLKDGNIDLKGL